MMSKENLIHKAYSMDMSETNSHIQEMLEQKLSEDAGLDITSEAVLERNTKVYGVIKAKCYGMLAGLEDVLEFYKNHGIDSTALKKDGDELFAGESIAELYGPEKEFLIVERTGLNLLQRMSGIATKTSKLAEVVKDYGIKIAGTRKTVLNYPDKKAIAIGGGLPHRMNLSDAIMIKDNHLSALYAEGVAPIETAIKRAYAAVEKYKPKFIEIEVRTLDGALKAAQTYLATSGIDRDSADAVPLIIMLDNMTAESVETVVKTFEETGLSDKIILEASGRINEKNLDVYAITGVDVISMGALTHSVTALDISQKITTGGDMND